MKHQLSQAGFTMAEMMIAMGGSTVVVGALLLSSISLQKSLHSAEQFAAVQADQRRLLDYVCRDLRRAVGIASTTTVGGVAGSKLSGGSVTVEGTASLLVTLPGYYQSQTPGDPAYDQPLPVVAADNYVDYGSSGSHAPGVRVIFRKQFDLGENCVCFFRFEDNTQTLIVRDADNLHLQVSVAPDGRSCTVQSTFLSPYSHALDKVATEREGMLLRNIRTD